MKQYYFVLVSGEYTSSINGVEETAQRTVIAAVRETQAEADAIVASGPAIGSRWGIAVTYVDTAILNAPPSFD